MGVRFEQSADASSSSGQRPFSARWQPVKEAWVEASYTADQQIAVLARILRNSTDARLTKIAEFGLNAVTAGHKVAVMAAIREIAAAHDPAKAAPKALQAVRGFRNHLERDPRIAACDQNPFGATVTLRAILGDALEKMEAVLNSA